MWLKVIVVGLKPAVGLAGSGQHSKPRATEVHCRYASPDCPSAVPGDQALAPFCWPLGPEHQSPKEFMAPEDFMFTLTQGDGSRLQGFCRRFLPPAPRVGSKLRYPQVLCLICEAAWSAFFFKVLEVTEQLLRQTDLLADFSHQQLPADSLAGHFLSNLSGVLAQQPALGSVVRVNLPQVSIPLAMSPPKRMGGAANAEPLPLLLNEELIELQVPPDAGNGTANAGVSLARLLWHVPAPAMVTLIASLLLERRVLVVGQSRDMVSAAVCAAQGLIHPFRWHHIFLPLLPRSLADYLTAPMPFLIGMPAQLLPSIRNLPMDEITLIDLDLGKCEPAPGTARDDAQLLPWREQLESALHAAFSLLKSPTEQESNPVIAGIMHGYFLKLLGSYRSHIYPEGTGTGFIPAGLGPTLPGTSTSGPASRQPGHQRSRSASPLHGGPSSNSLAAFAVDSSSRFSLRAAAASQPGSGGGNAASSRRQSRASSSTVGPVADEGMKAHGFWFDHAGLVATHRRNAKARDFLMLLRQSQLFEVFVRERLEMFAMLEGGPELSGDPFEQLVNTYLDNRSKRLSARLGAGVRSSLSRFGALIKKHRRAESTQMGPTFGLSSSSGADAGGGAGASSSASGGFASGLMSGLSRGRSGGFGERPEALKMRQMVAAFASAANQMRRNLTESGGKAGGLSSLEAFADKVVSVFDPSAFFDDDEDDAAEAEAAAAAAAAHGHHGSLLTRSSMSSSSLSDMVSGPLVAARPGSWSTGAASSSRAGPVAARPGEGSALADATTSSSSSIGAAGSMQHGGGGVFGAGGVSGRGAGSPPLGRHSLPASLHGTAAAAGAAAGRSAGRPPSPAPLIDLGDSSRSSSPNEPLAPAAQQPPQHSQQQQLPHHRYLDQLQLPSQQHQHQQQSHSPASPRELQAQWQSQQHSARVNRDSLIQQFMRPPLSSSVGSLRGSSGQQQQQQQQPQHINVKAALAAIAPGPLPQPPPPRTRSLMGGQLLNQFGQQQEPHMPQLRQGLLGNTSHVQQQLGGGAGLSGQAGAGADAATGGSSGSSGQPAQAAAAVWDPFAELVSERMASLTGSTALAPSAQQQPVVGMRPIAVHGRVLSAGSEEGGSAVGSGAGVNLLADNSSSSDGSSSSNSSDGGAASQASGFSSSTTPAGPTASQKSALAFQTALSQQQQHVQQPLQQQPTMPEAWLVVFAEGVGVRQTGGQGHCSSISFSGGQGGQPSAAAAEAQGQHEDPALSQLKQAFAQQLAVQHGSAGDDLL